MKFESLAHLTYSTHHVFLSRELERGHIHCFKYNQRQCDYQVFEPAEWDEGSHYVLEALPKWRWGFVEDNE
jgi:hypothetical protein